jgi:hypothetical protein
MISKILCPIILSLLLLQGQIATAKQEDWISAPPRLKDRLGYGYSSQTGRVLSQQCVTGKFRPIDNENAAITDGQVIETAQSEFFSTMARLELNARFRAPVGGAEGHSLQLSSRSASSFMHTIAARGTIAYPQKSFDSSTLTLTDYAKNLPAADFRRLCGDSFITGTTRGGSIDIVASLTTDNASETSSFDAFFKAYGQSLYASGSADVASEKRWEAQRRSGVLRIEYAVRGPVPDLAQGSGDLALASFEPRKSETLFAEIRTIILSDFPRKLASDPKTRVDIYYQVDTYSGVKGVRSLAPGQSDLAEHLRALDLIDSYLADLDLLDASSLDGFYFGPLDKTKVKEEKDAWAEIGRDYEILVDRCDEIPRDCQASKLDGFLAKARQLRDKRFARPAELYSIGLFLGVRESNKIHVEMQAPTVIVSTSNHYKSPVTILVTGEFNPYVPDGANAAAYCENVFGAALSLQSLGGTNYSLTNPADRLRIQAITGKAVIARTHGGGRASGDKVFIIAGWPRDRPLSVVFIDSQGLDKSRYGGCIEDKPYVVVWEPNRFALDAEAAVFDLASPGR